MKFLDREKFLATVTQWIQDGSKLESFWGNVFGEGVNLIGKDGCKENLVYYIDKFDYDNDLMNFPGDEPISTELSLFPIVFCREGLWWVDTGRGLVGPMNTEVEAIARVKILKARAKEDRRNRGTH